MHLSDTISESHWRALNYCLIMGLAAKIALSGLFLAPPHLISFNGPKVSEAATPVSYDADTSSVGPRVLALIEKERQSLQRREAALSAKEEQLRLLKKEVEERLQELQATQTRMLELLEEEKRIKGEHNRHLIATLETMPAERASKLLEKMDEEVAVQLLRRLKGKEAGAILGLLPADKAARLSQRLIKGSSGQTP